MSLDEVVVGAVDLPGVVDLERDLEALAHFVPPLAELCRSDGVQERCAERLEPELLGEGEAFLCVADRLVGNAGQHRVPRQLCEDLNLDARRGPVCKKLEGLPKLSTRTGTVAKVPP